MAPLDAGDATRARETVEQAVSEANRLGARLVFLPWKTRSSTGAPRAESIVTLRPEEGPE